MSTDLSENTEIKNGDVKRRPFPRGLSGKLLVLTTVVIMLTEIFVFVPSVANFRLIWLADNFATGEATSLALEQLSEEQVSDEIRNQLLSLTQTEMIVVRREGASRVLARKEMPGEIVRSVRLRMPGRWQAVNSITEAFDTLIFGGDRTIRVYGPMEQRDGTLELLMKEKPLRDAMLSYAQNVLLISLAISIFTGLVVFLTLRQWLIRPLQKMTGNMRAFAHSPEEKAHLIDVSGRRDEIGLAEEQMNDMQQQLRGTLKQQRHLADLGLAVSKINHDLRNILASASLFTERMSMSDDPLAKRLAPRLVKTIDRAVDYTTAVLAYGKSAESVPQRSLVRFHRLCEEVAETLALREPDESEPGIKVEWVNDVPENFEVEADPEQLFRVIMNLSRNALQAMEPKNDPSLVQRLTVAAKREGNDSVLHIRDTGPGFSAEMKEKLFAAFQTSGRNGGTGLGLNIAAELVHAHGGTIKLLDTSGLGACFEIRLPRVRTG